MKEIEAVAEVLNQGGDSSPGTFIELLHEQGFAIVGASVIDRISSLERQATELRARIDELMKDLAKLDEMAEKLSKRWRQ